MTADQFLQYVGTDPGNGTTKQQRLAIAKAKYAAYLKAYKVKTFLEAFRMGSVRWDYRAARCGLRDRDEGRRMVEVPELV